MRALAMGFVTCLLAGHAWGQIGGSPGSSTGASSRGSTTTNTGTTGGLGSVGGLGSSGIGSAGGLGDQAIYISGKVALNDGAALPEPVKIERVCSNDVHNTTHTDMKGRFNLDLARNLEVGDASDHTPGGTLRTARVGRNRVLLDCELRFSLPGFRTENITLPTQRYLDNPDLGTVILHRIANVEGLTVSATASLAPKEAKKAYEKGMDAVAKKKPADAQKDFAQAVELYPRYAAAWFALGRLNEEQNNFDEAQKSYGQAIVADAKFIPPHERLAWIALRDSNWQEVAGQSDTILSLDPIDYPDAYYLSGVGNFELGKLDVAEKNAREALSRDTTHRNPRTSYLLGLILAQKRDFAAAAPLIRTFLEQNPKEPDVAAIRQQLAAIEQAGQQAAAQSGAVPAP
jgi:tetratricopeptide (TPR) repeat protein